MQQLSQPQEHALLDLLAALIDQNNARLLVTPYAAQPGFWFGGGNLVQDEDGTIWMSGRYRNFGDSTTGLEAGQRGVECAIFSSSDNGLSFSKVVSWSKSDASSDVRSVLSFEGTALHRHTDGTWEFFVSSEQERSYPSPLEPFQKKGTGVWSIDRMTGPTPATLDKTTMQVAFTNTDRPEYLHVKDPVIFDLPDGATAMIFCSHPFSWSSSNTGLAIRQASGSDFELRTWEMIERGATWDVAATRVTGRMAVPQIGCFAGHPPVSVYFYDGAECLRPHEENPRALHRARGYSCEEIGGAMWGWDDRFPELSRLSRLHPLFVSPWGTGCSRYVETLVTDEGILAIWEQGQSDGSQPLVGHILPLDEVAAILSGRS